MGDVDRVLTILFWNLNKNRLDHSIVRLAMRYQIDVLTFAESTIPSERLLIALNQSGEATYHHAPSQGCKKIQTFTSFSVQNSPLVLEDDRLVARGLRWPNAINDILLAVLHGPSRMYLSETDLTTESAIFSDLVRTAERLVGHERTVLIGDFNMNPYDTGMVNANGFHGVMSRQIALRRTRSVQHRTYPLFYNPMWGLFDDLTPGAPGTFYRNEPGHESYFWHMLDQVLIRPALLEHFGPGSVQILDTDGERSFLKENGQPNKGESSDHLPILLRLNL